MLASDSGKVFDNTVNFFHSSIETKKFLDSYFTNDEIKGKIALDAGCRVGDNSIGLVKKGAKLVVGVDLGEKCITIAKERFSKNKELKFYHGDIRNLSQFKDSQFDIVICTGTVVYLRPEDVKIALREFMRVIKPQGIVLVAFQKNKGFFIRTSTWIANHLSLKIYIRLVDLISHLVIPFSPILMGRSVSIDYLKYEVLLGLRNLHFGIPVRIPEKFRVKTASSEYSSEKTTTTYKIKVPDNKIIAGLN